MVDLQSRHERIGKSIRNLKNLYQFFTFKMNFHVSLTRFYTLGYRPLAFGEKSKEITNSHNRNLVLATCIKQRIEDLCDPEDNLSLLQMVTDLFGFYKSCALNECRRIYDNFDEEKVQWVIGIPHSYKSRHKCLLRQAAFEAGIIQVPSCDTLILCTEAEAALMTVRDSGAEMDDYVTVADIGASRTTMETFKIINGQYLNVSSTTVRKGSENVDEELLSRLKNRVDGEYEHWTANIVGIAARIATQFKVFKEFSSMTKYPEAVKKIRIEKVTLLVNFRMTLYYLEIQKLKL
jgi:hypothetical protein